MILLTQTPSGIIQVSHHGQPISLNDLRIAISQTMNEKRYKMALWDDGMTHKYIDVRPTAKGIVKLLQTIIMYGNE